MQTVSPNRAAAGPQEALSADAYGSTTQNGTIKPARSMLKYPVSAVVCRLMNLVAL